MKDVKKIKTRSILAVFVALAGVGLGPGAARPAHAQGSVELPLIQGGSLRETLRSVTKDSGNTGFGDLVAGLTALEVGTTPLGSPTGGVVYNYVDEVSILRESLTFSPFLLERAATTGRLTATFGFNIVPASYDTISRFSTESLPVASFEGPNPIVTSSTLDLSVRTMTATGFATFGLGDNFDLGVAVPVVGVTIKGSQLIREAAVGEAVVPFDESSFGLGDLAITGKYRLWQGRDRRSGFAAHATLRAPTGSADELRGLDAWRTMVSGTASAGLGRASLHGTVGYEFWTDSVPLSNTLPNGTLETWSLGDQLQYGGGIEIQVAPALTVSLEGIGRRIGDAGELALRSFDVAAPAVGISAADLLAVGPGALTKTIIVPGITVSVEENLLFTFRAILSIDDTGLRSRFTPIIGFNWARCADC